MLARQQAFDETIERINKLYNQKQSIELRSDQNLVSRLTECGPENDIHIDCPDLDPINITLPVTGTGTVYHPSLPPMDCGFNISMDIMFCQSVGTTNSVVIFENFNLESFINPISDECYEWLVEWSNLTLEEKNQVFRDLQADFQSAYEKMFMELWASSPYNEFENCPTDGSSCDLANHAVQANYYKASCTKVCLVFERECEDPWGFLCRKEIPCYSDGCCKRERTYCLNSETEEVEICHEAFYVSACTTPVEKDPCVVELEECSDYPHCE